MTKPQIWIAAFLGLFLVLFLIGRVTKEDEAEQVIHNPTPQTEIGAQALSGSELVTKLGCTGCHGRDLTGTKMGPALTGLDEHWTRDALINYLRNPSAYSGDDRFKEYKKQFPNIMMPSFGNVDVKELGQISEYLLMK